MRSEVEVLVDKDVILKKYPSVKKCRGLKCSYLVARLRRYGWGRYVYVCEIVDRIPGNLAKCPLDRQSERS